MLCDISREVNVSIFDQPEEVYCSSLLFCLKSNILSLQKYICNAEDELRIEETILLIIKFRK